LRGDVFTLHSATHHAGARTASAAVWHDEDDDRQSVKLQEVPRLRKLRATEEENAVSGGTYEQKLRQR